MKELMAELLECCCLQQGREGLAEAIIAKHVDKMVAEASKLDAPPITDVDAGELPMGVGSYSGPPLEPKGVCAASDPADDYMNQPPDAGNSVSA